MERPLTRFAWNGEVGLAYQVFGDGPTDLVCLMSPSQVDMNWEGPQLARFLRGPARHARLIITDRRGWGCSERFSTSDVADIDTLTDDLLAVMDAAGSERATIIANLECGLVSMLFAAAYPDRAAGLVLIDCFPTYSWTQETPWGAHAPILGGGRGRAAHRMGNAVVHRPMERSARGRVVRSVRPGVGHTRRPRGRDPALPRNGRARRPSVDPRSDARHGRCRRHG